jgi:hypothetical protein
MIEQLTFWQQIGATILFLLLAFALREVICFFIGIGKVEDRLDEIIKILKK